MSANDPKRTFGDGWANSQKGSERHGRLGAAGVILDVVAVAPVIEELERGTPHVQQLNPSRNICQDIVDPGADAERSHLRGRPGEGACLPSTFGEARLDLSHHGYLPLPWCPPAWRSTTRCSSSGRRSPPCASGRPHPWARCCLHGSLRDACVKYGIELETALKQLKHGGFVRGPGDVVLRKAE